MKRADFLLACDTILYQYQKERKWENLSRIQELITSWSYENNYKILLEKAKIYEEKHHKLLYQRLNGNMENTKVVEEWKK
jgi:hypothetical protein